MNDTRTSTPTLDHDHTGVDDNGVPDPAAALASELVGETQTLELAKRIRLSMNGDDKCTAARLGVTYHAVPRMSRGTPTVDFLRRICRVYGVDGHWLLTGEGHVSPQDRAAQSLRVIPSELLFAEVARRLGRMLAATDPPPIETALRRGQSALDNLRSELPQPP